jgi:prepilin-type N-terminal cleavage/methylation domain-containing protein
MKSLKREQGFTLIEIVIVLAIAAAIMMMVFLAVQGARKTQRDTQRRADAARIGAMLDQYAANNGGAYPATALSPMLATSPSFWNDYEVAGTLTTPGTASNYTPGNFIITASTVGTLGAAGLDKVNIAILANSYQVCIGGETTAVICAQSK